MAETFKSQGTFATCLYCAKPLKPVRQERGTCNGGCERRWQMVLHAEYGKHVPTFGMLLPGESET